MFEMLWEKLSAQHFLSKPGGAFAFGSPEVVIFDCWLSQTLGWLPLALRLREGDCQLADPCSPPICPNKPPN